MFARHAVPLLVAPLVVLSGTAAALAGDRAAQAGPPVSYTDPADDAYRMPVLNTTAQVPDRQASSPALDLLEVGFAPGEARSKKTRGYTASITLNGVASKEGAYVSYGEFTSKGRRCTVHHFLNPGHYGIADVSCPDEEETIFADLVSWEPVAVTPTAGGGTMLSATFDNRRLPQVLMDAGATLGPLTALTCWVDKGGWRCPEPTVQDVARSDQSFRLA